MIKRLVRSKAAWTALAGIVAALGAGFTGELAWADALQVVFAGLVTLFLRDGIAKIE